MKKVTLIAIAVFALMSTAAFAQAGNTANGTLTVNATVSSSINLVFNSDAANGMALTSGTGTNIATLDFGSVSAFGALGSPKITRTVVAGTSFTVSTPVDVMVTTSNSSSANYTLKAQLNSADAVNSWAVGGAPITSASAAQITATGTYGSNVPETIAITIPFTTTSGTVISNIINFTATSN